MAATNDTLLQRMIAAHFQEFLDRHAFKEDGYKYDPINFGNEFLHLRSAAAVSLLFIIDRGCLEIRACPAADSSWIDISVFLEFLGHPLDFTNVENCQGIVRAENSSPVYARALEAHFETLFGLLQPQNFEKKQAQFDAFVRERGARLFGIAE